MDKQKIKTYLLYLFAFVGVLVSAYLTYEYSQPGDVTCQVGGCQTVRESEFAVFLGVSVPIWGVLFYLWLIGFAMRLTFPRPVSVWEKVIFLASITGGFAFSVYLTMAELFVIHAICQWCVISAVMSTAIYFLGYWMFSPVEVWEELKREK